MSDSDSFIDEVTEEVRRDRLFGYFRRYGWIAAVVIVVVVGGAAWNEYQKAQSLRRRPLATSFWPRCAKMTHPPVPHVCRRSIRSAPANPLSWPCRWPVRRLKRAILPAPPRR